MVSLVPLFAVARSPSTATSSQFLVAVETHRCAPGGRGHHGSRIVHPTTPRCSSRGHTDNSRLIHLTPNFSSCFCCIINHLTSCSSRRCSRDVVIHPTPIALLAAIHSDSTDVILFQDDPIAFSPPTRTSRPRMMNLIPSCSPSQLHLQNDPSYTTDQIFSRCAIIAYRNKA